MVEEGAIRTYEWYSTADNYSTIRKQSGETWKEFDARRFETKRIYAKDPENPYPHTKMLLKFSQKMSELVSEHTELAAKVSIDTVRACMGNEPRLSLVRWVLYDEPAYAAWEAALGTSES